MKKFSEEKKKTLTVHSVFLLSIESTPIKIIFLSRFLLIYVYRVQQVHFFLFITAVFMFFTLIRVPCPVSSWRKPLLARSTLPLIILVENFGHSKRFRDWPRIQLQEISPGLRPDGHSFTNKLLDGSTASHLKVISGLDVVHQVLAVRLNRLPSAVILDLVGVTRLEPQFIQDGFLGVAEPCWEISGVLADGLLRLTVGRKSKRGNCLRKSYAKGMKWAGTLETSRD